MGALEITRASGVLARWAKDSPLASQVLRIATLRATRDRKRKAYAAVRPLLPPEYVRCV